MNYLSQRARGAKPFAPLIPIYLLNEPYQGISFLNPFFLLLDSFWSLLESVDDAEFVPFAVLVPFVVLAAEPSVFAVSAVAPEAGAVESVAAVLLPSALVVAGGVVLSSAGVVLGGSGSPGFTVSTTAGDVPLALPVVPVDPVGPPPPVVDPVSVTCPPPPRRVSVSGLSESGSICGIP